MRLKVFGCALMCLSGLVLSGCSDNTVQSSSVITQNIEDKYSDISKHLARLNEIAKNNFYDIMLITMSQPPKDVNFKYSDANFSPTPSFFETDISKVLDSYSGYDWINDQGTIVLKLSNEDETHTLILTATFDSDDVLISSSLNDNQEITLDTPSSSEVGTIGTDYGSYWRPASPDTNTEFRDDTSTVVTEGTAPSDEEPVTSVEGTSTSDVAESTADANSALDTEDASTSDAVESVSDTSSAPDAGSSPTSDAAESMPDENSVAQSEEVTSNE